MVIFFGSSRSSVSSSDVPAADVPQTAVATLLPPTFYLSQQAALADLLVHLGIQSDTGQHNCEALLANGWRCQSQLIQSEADILRYNRPGIAAIYTDQGLRYVTIVRANNKQVFSLAAKGQGVISNMVLSQLQGDFLYLWQPPLTFTAPVYFGAEPGIINWLASAFASLDPQPQPLARDEFTSLLKQRIILFQETHGLSADGIAGVDTLLKLNEQLGRAVSLTGHRSE